MVPTYDKQMSYYTLLGYPINLVLGYCMTAASDPTRDYWCATHRIRIALRQSNLG